jgi:chromate transporter
LGGVSICVVALILQAVLGLWKKGVKDKLGIVIFAAVFALNMFTDISPIILVVGCGLVGIIAGSLRKGKGEVK